MALNKKPSMYQRAGHADARYLDALSKAALLDLCIELLRAQAGECDTPLCPQIVRDTIAPTLAARGDRLPNVTNP
jgi:hypothetical protein